MAAPSDKIRPNICFAVKKTTLHLLKGNRITDDTVLHSFFDFLKCSVHTIDCVKKCGLQTFITEVANNWKKLDSSVVVFGLQITAWLAENDAFYRHFTSSIHQIYSILCADVLASDLPDTSVLTALYETLAILVKQNDMLLKILQDIKIADIAMEGLRLLTVSTSIFLEKAVINFLSKFVPRLEVLDKDTETPDYRALATRLLSTVLKNIRRHYKKGQSGPFAPGSVQLLETLCRQSEVTSNCLLNQHAEFCEYLVDLTDKVRNKDCDAILRIIDALLHDRNNKENSTKNGDLMDGFVQKIQKQLTKLACTGNILAAQKVATCCLKIQGYEKLKETCVTVLTQPVYWILDENVKSSIFSGQNLQNALSARCRCTDIICRSLDSETINDSVITHILKRTIEFSGQEENQNSKAVSNLYKNRTIQRKCLEVLTVVRPSKNEDNITVLSKLQIITELFRETDSDTTIYFLCSQLLLEWFPSLFTTGREVTLAAVLAQVIQFHLCALHWELRDTTLELLGKIMAKYSDNTDIGNWLVDHRLHVQVWKCVADGESYVRASAVSALYHLCMCPQLLSALIESKEIRDEDDVIKTITDIVTKDTEAFARRAAITFLLKLFNAKVNGTVKDTSDIIPDVVMATILTASKDFDWEVKLVALDFFSFILHQEILQHYKGRNAISETPVYAKDLCNRVSVEAMDVEIELGVLMQKHWNIRLANALFDALGDFDEKVVEKALNILSEIQTELNVLTKSNKVPQRHLSCLRSDHCNPVFSDKSRKDLTKVKEDEIKKRKVTDADMPGTIKCMKFSEPSEGKQSGVDIEAKETENSDSKYTGISNGLECEVYDKKELELGPGKLSTKTEKREKNFSADTHTGSDNGLSSEVNDTCDIREGKREEENGSMLYRILDLDLSSYNLRLETEHDSSTKLLSLVEDIVTSENKAEEENAVDCY